VPSAKLTLEATALLVQHGENKYDSTGKLIYNAGGDFELSVKSDEDGNRKYSILNGRRVNTLTVQGLVRYELWRGVSFYVSALNRSVDYPEGAPVAPLEKPFGQLTLGAKALF
jgi:hypothetical protein